MTVLELKTIKPNQDVIKTLEDLLAAAKNGEIDSFLVFGSGNFADGTPAVIERHVGLIDIASTILAFECWKYNAVKDVTDERY